MRLKVELFGKKVELPGWEDRLAALRSKKTGHEKEDIEQFFTMSSDEREAYMRKHVYPHLTTPSSDAKERLAYYRSHGLDCCDDYPGGDAAFERDVLAGDQREEREYNFELKREDAYIMKCMENGKFKFDDKFCFGFYHHPKVRLELYERLDVRLDCPGGPLKFREDVLSPDSYLYKKEVI